MEAEKRRRRRGKASVVEKERKLRNQKTEEALWFSEFLQLPTIQNHCTTETPLHNSTPMQRTIAKEGAAAG
jgi:hypothetical protein